jgi:hypothetical protein
MFNSQQGKDFLSSSVSRLLKGPSRLKSVRYWFIFQLGKDVGYTAHHSPPRTAEVRNVWRYIFMVWCLMKHRDNFIFLLSPYHTFSPCQYTEATERIPMNGEDDQEASHSLPIVLFSSDPLWPDTVRQKCVASKGYHTVISINIHVNKMSR